MLGGRPGVHEHLAQSLGAGRHRHQLSGHSREMAFDDYFQGRGLEYRDPYGKDPALISGSRGNSTAYCKIGSGIAGNNWASGIGEKDTPVSIYGTPCPRTKCPSSPILIRPGRGNNAGVLNISEDGLALSAPQFCPSSSSEICTVSSWDLLIPWTSGCQIAWKSNSEKK